ncbi:hypothetical protein [Achromobacter sp. DH1f]|uniref:hypothetical protein n=1 Tax=Achromobacter sp. DH1f TaxID=1397275 RepID=UPI00046A4D4A|nr:hypothetical protein [Achromobacter sp. DH1f]
MQELEHIEVGQQANDGTGDPLRNGMVKVNANFSKVQTGVDAIELIAVGAKEQAAAAQIVADGAVPKSQKGIPGGVAPLDGTGKVPSAHLDDFVHADEKGAPGGVATLGTDGKVTPTQLPNAVDAIPMSQKGAAGGVATLDAGGKVPSGQLPRSGPPAGSVAWWPLRTSIPAGQIPADGQTASRATFPDLAAMVVAGTLPVVSEADWLADPLKRGAYTLGDGSTTIRMPDYNGKSSGSIGALFMRGDGSLSSGVDGSIQRDAMQNIAGSLDIGWGRNIARMVANPSGNTNGPFRTVVDGGNGYLVEGSARVASDYASSYTFDASRVARTASETRPSNVAGVWTVQAFGAVTNPGAADAAQLASDYAALNSAFQSLETSVGFVHYYPGGSLQNPPTIQTNTRYVYDNPFPGCPVVCEAQLRHPTLTDQWFDTGWLTTFNTSTVPAEWQTHGTRASQLGTGQIVVQTGRHSLAAPGSLSGGGGGEVDVFSNGRLRVRVWKVRGAL